MKRYIKRIVLLGICTGLIGLFFVLGINAYVKMSTADRILSTEEAAALKQIDCILVLGCRVHNNETPSDMLGDRLRRGMEVYDAGVSEKLLMSGDHGRKEYNEVMVMKQYAIDAGVDSSDVFMDHAGFSTYESIYRARDIFCADRILIVSQDYHLYRALHIADALGVEAYGVAADYHTYVGQPVREVREILARVKDFCTALWKPVPTYLGDPIPVSGDGNLTNDNTEAFAA